MIQEDSHSLVEQALKILEPLVNPLALEEGIYEIEGRDHTQTRVLSFGDQRAFAAWVLRARAHLSKDRVDVAEEDTLAVYNLYQRGLLVDEMFKSPGPIDFPGSCRERYPTGHGIAIKDSLFMRYPRLQSAFNNAVIAFGGYLDEISRHMSFGLVPAPAPWDPETPEDVE